MSNIYRVPINMQKQLADFLEVLEKERQFSHNTLLAYQNDLNQFGRFIQKQYASVRSVVDISPEMMTHYADFLQNEKRYVASTVARKLAAIKSFFQHFVSLKVLKHNPALNLEPPKLQKPVPIPLSKKEVEQLLGVPAKLTTAKGLRDHAILRILYATGMRVSELVELTVDDVRFKQALVSCHNNLGEVRYLPIDETTIEAIQIYLQEGRPAFMRQPKEKTLFLNQRGKQLTRQGLWLILKGYAQQVDLKVTPYTLRHSFAVHQLNAGKELHNLQKLLGHANLATTQIYAQFINKK